ncbi:ABC transporter ATP-binding protein [Paenibacillus sp. N3.4]|uniref:ABC transporter ATP-binding protein n=1 Tax=Paenibacillus sp. N3.4 TaxID=2603222 RepID=UPI0011CACC96|nr:ABC transporter ATP-binding protein [Paenibacillus sp. N3.4]TXK74017.1 ABC transporter ATP-binding protein [Paenibacillus sp. N3.4]
MIVAEKLTKRYANGFIAVNELQLHVKKGDIYGFLGPNGAGKTTTIRMLTGLLTPSEGRIHIQGMDIGDQVAKIKQHIGVLPESHGYYEWMTGMEYLSLFADLYGVGKKLKKSRVSEVLESVGLSDKSHISVGQYSRGMRQRLGIAKAIVHEPSIIFLDEPTLGLDPQGQKDIQSIIRDLNQRKQITIFITSHLLKEISEICNRVAIVNSGKLVEEGELSSLLYGYRDLLGKENPTLEEVFFFLTNREVVGREHM